MNINFYRLNKTSAYAKLRLDKKINNETFLDKIASVLSDKTDVLELEQGEISTQKFINTAKKIQLLCAEFNTVFIIKERCDIALYLNADGIFLPQEGLDINFCRHLLGEDKIIGVQINNLEDFDVTKCDYIICNQTNIIPQKPVWTLQSAKPDQANNLVFLYRKCQ